MATKSITAEYRAETLPLVSTTGKKWNFVLIAGAVGTTVVTLAYFFTFWNHFAGLRSGAGEFTAGSWFLQGLRPYRDYFVPSTPLNIFKSGIVLSLFGNALIVSRAVAVFERVVLALLLYFWLARMFRASHATLAALATIILSSADVSDPLASYNHDSILLAVAAGFLASYSLDEQRSARSIVLFGSLSGIFAGLSFATKQTIGAAATAVIPFIVCASLLRLWGARKAGSFLGGYCAGWGFVTAALLAWFAKLGILRDMFTQSFVQGPAAKFSHPSDFLVREIGVMFQLRSSAVAATAVLLLTWLAFRKTPQAKEKPDVLRTVLWMVLLSSISVLAGELASYNGVDWMSWPLMKTIVYFVFLGCFAQTIFYAIRWARGRVSPQDAQWWLYAGVSFGVAAMLSLSYPAFEAMIVPGLGLPAAAMLERSRHWRRGLVLATFALLIAAETLMKLNVPHGFVDFYELPVRSSFSSSSLPQLRGMVLPEKTVRFIDDTVRIIQENSSPSDTIFTYPELGLFYALSGRRCPTLSCSHNMDVASDDFARSEAARLLKNKPAVLIYYRIPVWLFVGQEMLWRRGRPSGERALIDACETLASEYRLVSVSQPEHSPPVMVYVRPR